MASAKKVFCLFTLFAGLIVVYTLFGRKMAIFYDKKPGYLVEEPGYLVGEPGYLVEERSDKLCENILNNITNGKWVRKVDLITDKSSVEYRQLVDEEEKYDAHMNKFRIKGGIKCRWKNCTNEMTKYQHAEFSEWIPTDAKCMQRNYTAIRACDVIKRFSKIYFVGDSFVRKMARGFILLARSNPTDGATSKIHKGDRRKLCVGADQFYWSQCNFGQGGFNETMVDDSPLCDMDLNNFAYYAYHDVRFATRYLNLVKQLAGKVGTLIFLGVGSHEGCKFNLTWENFVNPGVQYLNEFYKNRNDSAESHSQRWPRVIFTFPDTPSIFFSPKYRNWNGKIPCLKFTNQMTIYCKAHGVEVLDFRQLTSGVHSFDGVHYGLGVNLMKNRLLLNYLDSTSTTANWLKK